LRHDSTEAEQTLWQYLRGRRLAGAKFRRQHPLGPNYIVDFYCAEARLAVELDGSVHDTSRAHWADGIRHRQIQHAGVRVLRFTNEEVFNDLEHVLAVIREHLTPSLTATPSPPMERGLGGEVGDASDPPTERGLGGEVGDASDPPMERGLGGEVGDASDPPPGPPPHQWGGGQGERWSEALWRSAETLKPGDRIVAGKDGANGLNQTLRIESIDRAFTQEAVYDLTVEEDHSFVTEIGVAHNCGSGTTAYVAEQWGRRWITMDVSRVPLALARQRLLTATFAWYELQDESRGPAGGFVYKRKQNSKKACEVIENGEPVFGIPATYVQATPDLMMGDLLKNMRSSQIFSVCGLPEIKIHHKGTNDTKAYQVELVGLDVFDPVTMEVEHRSGDDVPAWLLDTDYNGLCFHVSQAFFPRTSAWDSLKKALKGEYEESVWDHLAGTISAPFEAGETGQIAVKVIDDRGNELLVVKTLKDAVEA
jgi:very-short-patch-repair endonuclease